MGWIIFESIFSFLEMLTSCFFATGGVDFYIICYYDLPGEVVDRSFMVFG